MQAVALLADHREELRRRGVAELAIFGSLARGEATPESDVDLLVTDVVMPGMDGPSWVQKALKKRPETRVVFVSGYADDAFGHSLDPDADFVFLPKPYTLAQIAETVKENIA